MAVKKSKKIPIFFIYVIVKDNVFTAVKERGTINILFRGRYTKEIPFLPKMVYKRERGSTSGWDLPV